MSYTNYRSIGIENELIRKNKELATTTIKEIIDLNIAQQTMTDGDDIEIITKPIRLDKLYTKEVSTKLQKYYKVLAKYHVSRSATGSGTHIHITVMPWDRKDLANRIWNMSIPWAKQFIKICGRGNIGGTKYYSIETRKKYIRPDYFKRQFITPNDLGTIEFRGPKASHNFEEHMAWIELLSNMVDIANEVDDIENIKWKDIIAKGPYLKKYLKKRRINFSKEELNKKLGRLPCA
jgi:hypothetical protein